MNPAVLIIDDEPNVLQAIRRLLMRDQHPVHLAADGRQGLEILAQEEIGVIICDQRMPGLSGAEVLAEAVKIRPDAYRITLTAYADMKAAQASINQGNVNVFLLKPWDDDQLRRVVREGMRSYELVQDHRRLEALTQQQKAELESWNQQLEDQVQQRTAELQEQNEHLLDLQHRVEQSLRDTVKVLASLLEAYSPSLGIHDKRVAHLARQLGTQLGLKGEELRDIEFAGYLHDIGKLSKLHQDGLHAGRGASARREQITIRHPESGYAILAHVAGFENVAWAVRYQEERFDGTGHPEGLAGEDIPLGSRIVAIASAYDEVVFPADNPTQVRRELGQRTLIENQGKRFDPHLVTTLLKYLGTLNESPDGDGEIQVSVKQVREGMVLSREVRNADNVLLLSNGVVCTSAIIERLRAISAVDPFLTSVFVRCLTRPKAASTGMGLPRQPSHRPHELEGSASSPAWPANPPQEEPVASTGEDRHHPPARVTAPAAPPVTGDRPPQAASAGLKQCLIVDDSPLVRNALVRELRRAGFECTGTEDGNEALRWASQAHYDVAIVDLAMPSMPGSELIEHLRHDVPGLPCVILTGNAKREEVVQLSKAPNVAGILVKPWDHERLMDTVTIAVDRALVDTPQ